MFLRRCRLSGIARLGGRALRGRTALALQSQGILIFYRASGGRNLVAQSTVRAFAQTLSPWWQGQLCLFVVLCLSAVARVYGPAGTRLGWRGFSPQCAPPDARAPAVPALRAVAAFLASLSVGPVGGARGRFPPLESPFLVVGSSPGGLVAGVAQVVGGVATSPRIGDGTPWWAWRRKKRRLPRAWS